MPEDTVPQHDGMMERAKRVRAGQSKGSLKAEVNGVHDLAVAMLADGDKLLERAHLIERFKEFGLCRDNSQSMAHLQDWFNSSSVGLLQIPTEFADFLLYCAKYRPSSMVEIGVYTGGTSFMAAAFFKALNPEFKLTAVDIADYILLEQRTIDLLDIQICTPKTSGDFYAQEFDIVFIDGDHSYKWAKTDYLNLGRFAKYVCGFHDINAHECSKTDGGIVKFWRQLRHSLAEKYAVIQISHSALGTGMREDGDWMGIGVVDHGGRAAS